MAYTIAQPKSIFELLGLPASATRAEVVTAYQALCRHFESGDHGLSAALAEYKLASLRSAMETYSSGDMGSTTASSRVPNILVASPPVIWSEIDGESPLWAKRRKKFAIMSSWTSTGLKFLLGFLGIVFMFKMMFSFSGPQVSMATPESISIMQQQAEDKMVIQEYYQETGFLAASRSEVDALRAEERIKANERRAELQAQREEEAQQREYERFVEESRRIGDSVSEKLQRQEARQQQIEAQQKEQEELQQRYKEQELARMEKERINAERRRLGMTPVY
jgi:hypothetical protein